MIDQKDLRNALGCFATGVTIITTSDQDNKPVGLTINSFTSLSLEPPLIIWSISKNAPSYEAFKYKKQFIVNVLSSDQGNLVKIFSTPSNDKFINVNWDMNDQGLPYIKECVANFECIIHSVYPGGDHQVLIGKVVKYQYNDRKPLIMSRGKPI
tara:strand:- start:3668 stop:4129 length:462 start_codon:yes stop_codon:yes gene_type:complete